MRRIAGVLILLFAVLTARAQQTVVTGRVIDKTTGDALPFVNIFLKGTHAGTATDFDGYYKINYDGPVDSIGATYVGYRPKMKAVVPGKTQSIDFYLEEEANIVDEIVVTPGENPAIAIIRNAQKNRDQNDMRSLIAYECESFNKIQLAVDHLSEKYKKKRMFRQIMPLFDTISSLTEDNNQPVLPVFISESLSDFYVLMKPYLTREYIKASKVTGVGVTDGSLMSQIIGSTFQQYNFYENWVDILDKNFVSPIGHAALDYYIFTLRDTVIIDGQYCYEIQVNPRRAADLAFTGKIWVHDTTFALKRVILEINSKANLNFIDKIKIQQESELTVAGAWVPSKTRILINVDELSDNSPGMIALFYNSNKNYIVNRPKPPKFYETRIEVAPDAQMHEENYWTENRHDTLSESEQKVYRMVDTLRNLPIIKTWVSYVDLAINGYKDLGKIQIGPYALLYGYNSLEGNRFRIGAKTDDDFSKKWIFTGYVAYGTLDQRFKYGTQAEYILSRKHWTILGYKHKNDVEQIGVNDKNYGTGNLFTQVSVFQANQLNRTRENRVWATRDLKKGITATATFLNKFYQFEPIRTFNFAYLEEQPQTPNAQQPRLVSNDYTNTSLTLEMRFAMKELFVINGNERISLGNGNSPEVTVAYTRGFKNLFNGNFNYNRAEVEVRQYLPMGRFGTGDYILTAGKVFDPLPYPLLQVQRGNQSFMSSRRAYNLMNFFEFVTDQYVAMNYEHHFEGLFTNRLPAVKKWKLRLFATAKGVWGSISDKNLALMPTYDANGRAVSGFYKLNREPYVELGYGVENIFKILRVDFVHRLTHLGNPGAKRFAIKLAVQLSF